MSESKSPASGARKVRTLEEEITAQREKLKKLEERQRDQQRKDRERNTKAVVELIKQEKLDMVTAEQWKDAMPAIKLALKVNPAQQAEPAKPVQSAVGRRDEVKAA